MIKFNRIFKPKVTRLVVAGATLCALVGIFAVAEISKPSIIKQKWILVEPKPLSLKLGLVGRVEPAFLFTVIAPFNGAIVQKSFEEGQQVKRGQVSMRFDVEELETHLREAQATVIKAKRVVFDLAHWEQGQEVARARRSAMVIQMNLSDTKRKLSETNVLLARGIVPRIEVDALEQQEKAQQLDFMASQSEFKLTLDKGSGENKKIAALELENATVAYDALKKLREQQDLVAPFTGIVLRAPGIASDRSISEPIQNGVRVTRGQPLLGLASVERFKVTVKVDETDINQIQDGQLVEITGDGFNGITLSGKIVFVGSQAVSSNSQGSGAMYEVIVSVLSPTADQLKYFKLGMTAKLAITTYRNENAIVVLPDMIQKNKEETFVEYRESESGKTQYIRVKVGHVTADGVEVFGLKRGYVRLLSDA